MRCKDDPLRGIAPHMMGMRVENPLLDYDSPNKQFVERLSVLLVAQLGVKMLWKEVGPNSIWVWHYFLVSEG